jgi:hypothetical protein
MIIFLAFVSLFTQAQDSLQMRRDSIAQQLRTDSLRRDSLVRDSLQQDSIRQIRRFSPDTNLYALNPFFRFTDPIRMTVSVRRWQGKEGMFYSVIGLLLFFAFIRNGFSRYLSDLFQTFFRTSIKQKQIKEQLLQSPLPSLLMNIFFILCVAFFGAIVLRYFGLGNQFDFWQLYLYAVLALAGIYLLKFISLKVLGWIFQASDSADAYIFIVFTTNKMIGIALLPLVVIMAFTEGTVYESVFSFGLILIGGCFLYRYFLAFSTVHRQLRINILHFLVYLTAFEIIPLLLINKLLFQFLS